jgi:TonB-linked SusC/RagA family outer membrane protein
MKLTTFFLLITFINVSASVYSQGTRLDLKVQSTTIKDVLNRIEDQSNFFFMYNDRKIDVERKVDLDLKETKVEAALKTIFEGTNTKFIIKDRQIVLYNESEDEFLILNTLPGSQQQKTISGKVNDSTGAWLPGVSVVIKGTTTGVTTDMDGKYTLTKVPENATLLFSFVGMKTQEFVVGGKSTINVTLEEEAIGLDEVVAVGYGTQKRSDVTGSIFSISSASLKDLNLTSTDQALKGQVAGVQMTQTSSAPGGNSSVRIRGGNSISAGNEPLYVVDGFPIYNDNGLYASGTLDNAQPGNILASINPNDIASIEILKDASATAIYGSRGANGVVIINTKRGKSGMSKIEFEMYYGLQQISHKIPLLNATDYAILANEQQRILGRPIPYPNPESYGEGTDWQDEGFQIAPIQNYQLSFTGGDDKTRFALSGNYFNQEGILKGSAFERGSIRVNLDRDFGSKFKIGISFSASRTNNNQSKTDTDNGNNASSGAVSKILGTSPTQTVYDSEGNYSRFYGSDGNFNINPIALLLETLNQSRTSRILGNVFADYKILDGLTARVTLGGDQINVKEDYYYPAFIQEVGASAVAKMGFIQSFSWLNENTLTYNKVFSQEHSFTGLIGFTRQAFSRESARTGAQKFVNDILEDNSLNSGTIPLPPSSNRSDWAIESYIGRINYSFRDRYLATLTGRYDGSSRFGASNKYSFFPSGSLAWRISEEQFMKTQQIVDNLKLRMSYGVTGNQEIPQYRSLAALGNSNYPLGGVIQSGLNPTRISNPDLRWESTAQFNVGLDIGLLTSRIQLIADYYDKRTSDLLLDVSIPGSSGFSSALQNTGDIQNRGVEFALNTINLEGQFNWKTSFNISFNKNKVLSLGGDLERPAGQASPSKQLPNSGILRVGEPVGVFYGYITDGLFQTLEEIKGSAQPTAQLGDRRFKDLNNDAAITATDRTILGYAQPDFTYGFTNTFSYKGFDLNIFMQGVQGNSILNLNLNAETDNNIPEAKNRWTTTNTNTDIPRTVVGSRITNKYVEDGSYLRIQNITLGYTLPKNLSSSVNLQSVRVYMSAQNWFTFTNYSGYDPEVSTFGQDNLSMGVDRGSYPAAKTFTFGINIGL